MHKLETEVVRVLLCFFNGSLSFMHFEFKALITNVKFALRLRHGGFTRRCFENRCCGKTHGFKHTGPQLNPH